VLTLATYSTLSMISVLVAKPVLVEVTLTVFVDVDAVTVSLFLKISKLYSESKLFDWFLPKSRSDCNSCRRPS
jgi:hypothetical protein